MRARTVRESEAYARRLRCREILFAHGNRHLPDMSESERAFVKMVLDEAYAAYLHRFRTGERRYQGGVLNMVERHEPLRKTQYRKIWYGAQKLRYLVSDRKKIDGTITALS